MENDKTGYVGGFVGSQGMTEKAGTQEGYVGGFIGQEGNVRN